jgi:uncharacterized glyoxalase superfamily metalloenzyme YdcJ
MANQHLAPDIIRALFSAAMSAMYRAETPQYSALLELVADVNARTLDRDPELRASLERGGEIERLDVERHGAIRVGTADELSMIRRLFAVMGMRPVGYYDLAPAGVPVHATAFRPVDQDGLRRNPFRVFTSLLRLDLIADEALRAQAAAILAQRQIFTPGALALIEHAEREGGLTRTEAEAFVREAIETFRWRGEATIDAETYRRLHEAHRLIADIVSFHGPHINHLTPRTLDIDAVQAEMPLRGIAAKAVIEGPPPRRCPILLRQTSFKALEERVTFRNASGATDSGTHTARFGEVEQRGAAMTPKGRALYDALLPGPADPAALAERFAAMPDAWPILRAEGLVYFRYAPTAEGLAAARRETLPESVDALLAAGHLTADPIVYEDFLPVSAAGIFQSNLGADAGRASVGAADRAAFEQALGLPVLDEFALYARIETASIRDSLAALGCGQAAGSSSVSTSR